MSFVITNIYMEYLRAYIRSWMSPTLTMVQKYVDDVISIVMKTEMDILCDNLNAMDPHMMFTIKFPGDDGSIPFMDTKSLSNEDHPIQTSVYRSQHTLIITLIET